MNSLPAISVRRPVGTLMFFFAAVVVGVMCITQIPLDLMPKMDIPRLTVITFYEGAGPEDVEEKVTDVLERWLSAVPELKHITSSSRENLSVISLEFNWGTDLDARANEVRDYIGQSKSFLPDDVDEPRVMKFNVSGFPILVMGISASESYGRLAEIMDDTVVRPLKRLPGVASVVVNTPLKRQVNVNLDRQKLAALAITPPDVVRAIASENVDTPGGNIKAGITDYLIRVRGEFRDLGSLRNMTVMMKNGAPVRLSDLGYVEDGFDDIYRYVTIDGGPGGVLFVLKQSDANTVQVAKAVKKRMEELKKRLPSDVHITEIMDASEDIGRMINDLQGTLLMGGLFTMLVILAFLTRWQPTLIIGISIPFSLVLGVIAMYFLGYTLNMITMFSLIVVVGMVVDNSIVVLDNITRHRDEGERPNEGAVYGTMEVGMPIVASTLTTLCVFFPVLFVQGITKVIFSEFTVVVCVVLLSSLFSALTLTPMLASTMMRSTRQRGRQGRLSYWFEHGFDGLVKAYDRILVFVMKRRAMTIGVTALIFVTSLPLLYFVGGEFMPEEDRGMLRGSIHLPVGTRVEETARVMKEIDRILQDEVPLSERRGLFTRCGTSPEGASGMFGEEGPHIGLFGVRLAPRSQRSRDIKEITAAVRKRVNDSRGLLGFEKFRLEKSDPMEAMMSGGELPLTVNIVGDDFEALDKAAEMVKKAVESTPGAVDISISRTKGRPELSVNLDRNKTGSLGLTAGGIGDTVRSSFAGKVAGRYRIRGDEYDIAVRLQQSDRSDTSDLLSSRTRQPNGALARTDNVGKTEVQFGPVEIAHKDQGRIVNVVGNVEGRALGDVVADVEKKIKELKLPAGVDWAMGGQTTDQRESFFWLRIALMVGMMLVYMVMAWQFESFVDPFAVMFSIPFAFTGVIWTMVLTGIHLNIVVFIGMLLLIGIVVNNAIVLVDYINVLRARGLPLDEAVRGAGRTRLRPVLMTAITTIVGLIPMAFAKGQGSEVWNPLGLTVLGGMVVSTAITMIIVPVMYTILERGRFGSARNR